MKPKPTKHICIDCHKKWTEMSVEDEPIYTKCNSCYSAMVREEIEIAGNND